MLIKFIILLLRINISIATTIKNKIKTMFRFFFFIILVNNLNEFSYLISIKDNKIMSKRKVIRAMHKTTSNKILKINNVINCVLQQLICIVLS
jgi:hypothetical protein